VPDELLLGPVGLPAELATVSLLELRQDRGESRFRAVATDGHAEGSELVR
jgi:hypothetical protein